MHGDLLLTRIKRISVEDACTAYFVMHVWCGVHSLGAVVELTFDMDEARYMFVCVNVDR
jgi:hypothetical protein